jgi:propanol-preferring alcohol dehydrogenase
MQATGSLGPDSSFIEEVLIMKAMVLAELGPVDSHRKPLKPREMEVPAPGPGEVLLRVTRCAVCHTELDEIEGRTPPSRLPMILGHQVVGVVESSGESQARLQTEAGEEFLAPPGVGFASQGRETLNSSALGSRVGVAWIGSACGECEYCRSGRENLCPHFQATGRDMDGGYAEYMTVLADFVHRIPELFTDSEAAPLLCAGAIGYRSLWLSNLGNGKTLGLMGFGGSNHLVLKMAQHKFPDSPVLVFSRSAEEQEFARSLGAAWAGGIEAAPPELADAIIDTTPVWKPDLEALKRLKPGGRLVINAIRKQENDKEALTSLDYPSQLWMEKEIKSVANVTRMDVREFLKLAAEADIKPELQEYGLEEANQALVEMKMGKIRGAKVLKIG